MAKTKRTAGKRGTMADRNRLRVRKSGVSKAGKPGLRKQKPAKTDPSKQKSSLRSETARLKRQLKAARMQQEAGAEILRAVANASRDAAVPLQLIAETTARLFEASSVAIQLAEGDEFTQEYRVGASAKRVGSAYPRSNIKVGGRNLPGTVVAENRQIHIPDLDQLDPSMSDFPGLPHARAGGARTVCGTPLRREHKAIGALIVLRDRLLPFTDDELALLQSFADQAVIAIENKRLFNEVEAKTRDLGEALEQQTATADALKVISRSAFDLDAVMHTLARSAAELCAAGLCGLYIREGDFLVCRGYTAISKEQEEFVRQARIPAFDPDFATNRVLASGEIANIGDFKNDRSVATQAFQEKLGFKSLLIVPLMREGQGIGLFILGRDRVGQFSPRHVELVQTFADQAVIAIENARLFAEVQARTRDLGEALEQQTATSEVLAVISRSPSDLNPVLQAISDTAARLCGSEQTMFFRYDGNVFRILASWNFPPEVHEMLERRPLMPGHPSAIGRAGASLKPVCIPDVLADPAYGLTGEQSRARYRATLAVPLLREGRLIGALSLNRSEPGAFTEKQIELVATFADQAVIAIENVRLFDEVQAKTRDLSEALTYQTGSANILNVIASSPTDVAPVLKAIVESACEVCEAYDAAVLLRDGDDLRFSAHHGPIPIGLTKWPINRRWTAGRAFIDRQPVHIEDLRDEKHADFSDGRELSLRMGHRTIASVPLLCDKESVGAIVLRRVEVHPFSGKQIALLQTFADQAVIAIQNARLFNETREALERQTATAEILKVIASSPDDVQPVFQAIAERSNHLVGGFATIVVSIIDDVVHLSAFTSTTPAADAALRAFYPRPLSGFTYADAVRRGEIHRIVDAEVELAGESDQLTMVRQRGWRSALWVPLLLEGEAIGVIGVTRVDPGPFADHHVDMLKTFADQAVIAISNVNLFRQVQERTRDLQESLQQQTATAEMLKVISRSAFDLRAVLTTLVRSALDLCNAPIGTFFLREGDVLRLASQIGCTPELVQYFHDNPIPLNQNSGAGRAFSTGRVVHFPDVLADPDYRLSEVQRLGGYRSLLAVPLLRERETIGVFSLSRTRPEPFSQRQIDLVQTFADQAVIAIENTRLFNETREALARQTATADILRIISRSVAHAAPVFDTILESCQRLFKPYDTAVYLVEGDKVRGVARRGPGTGDWGADSMPLEGSSTGVAIARRQPVHFPDLADKADVPEDKRAALKEMGGMTVLYAPMISQDSGVGSLVVTRRPKQPFTNAEIGLIQTFADQAVIAIENARLFEEVQARTRELSLSLDDLRAAQDRLVQTEKLASLGQLTAGIAHEIKNPLNFVNNFSALSIELIDEMTDLFENPTLDEAGRRKELDEIRELLKSNLEKVVQHGKRADSIVKNMLLHSREGSGEQRAVDINALLDESLNLAYHGARAEKPGFNITLRRDLDPDAGLIELFPQEITRALLNLISNGFYAASKREAENGEAAFEPVLSAATKDLGNHIEIRIRDNGTGIPPEVKEKMFNPFFTTKPAGEGTGLGLSMSHDIIVKQHGGRIEVDTQPGQFTEFTIVLPRATTPANNRKD